MIQPPSSRSQRADAPASHAATTQGRADADTAVEITATAVAGSFRASAAVALDTVVGTAAVND